jgi:large subunit ribosomal protein L6
MSKIGKQPIKIPEGVEVSLKEDLLSVAGSGGKLGLKIAPKIKVAIGNKEAIVSRLREDKQTRANQGTIRQLIVNMIQGVKEGWVKNLEIHGTGYRVKLEGEKLILSLGFSHPVEVIPPEGIKFQTEKNLIKVAGIDKALVGREAAKIRAVRPPDVYKGKGIRYQGEKIKLKPGKAAKMGAAGVGG